MEDAGAIVMLGAVGYYFQNKYKEQMKNNNKVDNSHWKEVKRSAQIRAKKVQEEGKNPDKTKRVSAVYRDIGNVDESAAIGTIDSNVQKYVMDHRKAMNSSNFQLLQRAEANGTVPAWSGITDDFMYPETRDAFQNKEVKPHNNMQPYFGSHVNTVNPQPSVLERFTGQRVMEAKKEQEGRTNAPNRNFNFPESDEQRKTRYQPSMYHTEPAFQPEQVGPNTKDIRIRAPTVDELRTKDNQKVSYEQPVVSGSSRIANRGELPNMEQRVQKTVKPLSVGERGNVRLSGHRSQNKCLHTKDNRKQLNQLPMGNVRQSEQVYKNVPNAITNTLRSINNTVDYFTNIVSSQMGNTVQSKMSYISRSENKYNGVNKLNAAQNSGHEAKLNAPDTTQRQTVQNREVLNVGTSSGHTQKPSDSFRNTQRMELAGAAADNQAQVGFKSDRDNHTTRFEDKAKISGREYLAQDAKRTGTSGEKKVSVHFEDKVNMTGRETLEEFEVTNAGTEIPCLKLGLMDELNPTGRETLESEDTAGNLAPISEIYVPHEDIARNTQKEELVDKNVKNHPGSQIPQSQNYDTAYNATVNTAKEESVKGRMPATQGNKIASSQDEIGEISICDMSLDIPFGSTGVSGASNNERVYGDVRLRKRLGEE